VIPETFLSYHVHLSNIHTSFDPAEIIPSFSYGGILRLPMRE